VKLQLHATGAQIPDMKKADVSAEIQAAKVSCLKLGVRILPFPYRDAKC
jgi:hypothetical protein